MRDGKGEHCEEKVGKPFKSTQADGKGQDLLGVRNPGSNKHLGQEPTSVDDGGHETNDKRVVSEGGSEDRHDGVDVPKAVSHEKEANIQGVNDDVMAKMLRDGCRDVILRADAEQIRKAVADTICHRYLLYARL